MPEAVTTQGETLWIGTTRSSMRRVPYLVSSPEIAPPAQMIDATNLASDAKVYIPGLKDYGGDLVWEANSQYFRPGELRDLLDMDGCDVWAERRMPMVGVRVSLQGRASVSMSAASPDSVQRVTVRIAPSGPMAVEQWDPSMSEGCTVRLLVDTATRMNIRRVDVAYGGREYETVVSDSTRGQGAANIPSEWAFNGGVGPFGCFYAAFNIDAYTAGTETEEPICTEAGRIAYKLDPYHLKRTLGGTTLAGTYNVFLVIPTLYWRGGTDRFGLSNVQSSGYTAYAHTADGTVYPYIGIGVYEASDDGTRLLSKPGATPSVSKTHDAFKALADALTPATGCGYQQVNYYQWTLLKAMAYSIMGTKNAQWMLGDGPVAGGTASTTGLADEAGPYTDSTDSYDKMLVENAWGSVWEIIGDTMVSDYALCAGQTLGGAVLGGQAAISGANLPDNSAIRWIDTAQAGSESWDLPATATDTSTATDPAKCGDIVRVGSGQRSFLVGGSSTYRAQAGLGCVYATGALDAATDVTGTRLSYFINDYALGLSDAAPAVTRTLASSPTRTVEAVPLERTEVSAVSRDEEAVPDATDVEEASEDVSEDEASQEAVSVVEEPLSEEGDAEQEETQ